MNNSVKQFSFKSRVKSLLNTFINYSENLDSTHLQDNLNYCIQVESILEYIKKIEQLINDNSKSKKHHAFEQIKHIQIKFKSCVPQMTNFDFNDRALTVWIGKYKKNQHSIATMMECSVINNKCQICVNKNEYDTLQHLNALGSMLFKEKINLLDLCCCFIAEDCHQTYLITETSDPTDINSVIASAPPLEPPPYSKE